MPRFYDRHARASYALKRLNGQDVGVAGVADARDEENGTGSENKNYATDSSKGNKEHSVGLALYLQLIKVVRVMSVQTLGFSVLGVATLPMGSLAY